MVDLKLFVVLSAFLCGATLLSSYLSRLVCYELLFNSVGDYNINVWLITFYYCISPIIC